MSTAAFQGFDLRVLTLPYFDLHEHISDPHGPLIYMCLIILVARSHHYDTKKPKGNNLLGVVKINS